MQGYFWSKIWMGHENGPMAHVTFICMQKSRFWWAFKNFDGPFGKKWWAQETLISNLQQNEHQPKMKSELPYSINYSFFIKWFRLIPDNLYLNLLQAIFIMKVKQYKEQSDLDPYCLQYYRLTVHKQMWEQTTIVLNDRKRVKMLLTKLTFSWGSVSSRRESTPAAKEKYCNVTRQAMRLLLLSLTTCKTGPFPAILGKRPLAKIGKKRST